jgi:hypothetical protein
MDGYALAAHIRRVPRLKGVPILLLAGAFEPVDQARAEQVRCDGVLIKPFEPRQVIERVRELLEGVKGSPAQATADVPRPVDRLSPRPEPQPVSVPPAAAPPIPAAPASMPAPSPVAVAAAPEPPAETSAFDGDLSLDEYFESLNAAFDSVGHPPERSIPPVIDVAPVFTPPAPPPDVTASRTVPDGRAPGHARRRGDSLDEYFDRLSTAFEQAKPADAARPLPDGFDELLDEPGVATTVDALVGVRAGHDTKGGGTRHGANGTPHPGARVNGHGHTESHSRNPIVAALEALLAEESPASDAAVQPLLPGLPEFPVETPRSELADAVTQRVLERLLPEITATVQRVVREEVERFRRLQ